jgi:hypothetical protein
LYSTHFKEELQMKKLTIIALVVAVTAFFAVSASANEWNLYGSARMATYWTSQDYGGDTEDQWGRGSVDELQWQMQVNSRVGATVKGDQIEGRFEFSVTSDGGGGNVGARRLYGVWKFTEGWGLKVGKDYTPITFFLSGQVFDNDQGLLNVGNAYGSRRAQLAVEGMAGPGMLKVALIDPTTGALTVNPAPGFTVDTTTEAKLPKLEASYDFKLSDTMSIQGFGGWQYFKQLQAITAQAAPGVTNQRSDSVTSYMFGVGADLNFGPMYVKPQVSWYRNGASAGWLSEFVGLGNPVNPLTGDPISQVPFIAQDGTIVDQDSLMAMLALGFKPTESLGLEAGGGYLRTKDDNDTANTYMEYYLQAVWTLAKGVYLVPEVGYRDYGDLEPGGVAPDVDLGNLWYAGAKWQIDF